MPPGGGARIFQENSKFSEELAGFYIILTVCVRGVMLSGSNRNFGEFEFQSSSLYSLTRKNPCEKCGYISSPPHLWVK